MAPTPSVHRMLSGVPGSGQRKETGKARTHKFLNKQLTLIVASTRLNVLDQFLKHYCCFRLNTPLSQELPCVLQEAWQLPWALPTRCQWHPSPTKNISRHCQKTRRGERAGGVSSWKSLLQTLFCLVLTSLRDTYYTFKNCFPRGHAYRTGQHGGLPTIGYAPYPTAM